MKINGNIVQGIYKYDPLIGDTGIEFTKGDFVVCGDSIYTCIAESVSGVNPIDDTENQYFLPYPGSQITTASEFFQYVDSGIGGDKYVSAQSIYGILQGYQFGLDITGVISAWIDKNGDTTLNLSSITKNPIDNLMLTEDLNRGMVKISHELPQIVDTTLNGVPFSTLFGFLDNSDPEKKLDYQLILSQYTYKSSSTTYVRVQEMTSPLSGVSVYRFLTWKEGNFPIDGGAISRWRSVYSYSKAIQTKLYALDIYYKTLADQISAKKASLSGSFRFKEISFNGSSVILSRDGVYTISLLGDVEDKTYSESATFRISIGSSSYTVNLKTLSGAIVVDNNSGVVRITGGSNIRVVSIYLREEIES